MKILSDAGFQVERFTAHFPDGREVGTRQQSVKDPKVIQLCNAKGYLLVTTDREMRTTFIDELKATEIAILATANNNEGDDIWAARIAKEKVRILRGFKNLERPYFNVIQKSGAIRVEILRMEMTTRRVRRNERDE